MESCGFRDQRFQVFEDRCLGVLIQDPADFVLVDVLGYCGVWASGEEDGAADSEGSEEFGGDDGSGPIFVEVDQVDVGGGEAVWWGELTFDRLEAARIGGPHSWTSHPLN